MSQKELEMNQRLSISMEHLEIYLGIWGRWCCLHCDNKLDYPKYTVLAQVAELGDNKNDLQFQQSLSFNKVGELIEQGIRQLHQVLPREAAVIRAVYVGKGSANAKAQKMGIKYAIFKRHLDLGKCWLLGAINGFSDDLSQLTSAELSSLV